MHYCFQCFEQTNPDNKDLIKDFANSGACEMQKLKSLSTQFSAITSSTINYFCPLPSPYSLLFRLCNTAGNYGESGAECMAGQHAHKHIHFRTFARELDKVLQGHSNAVYIQFNKTQFCKLVWLYPCILLVFMWFTHNETGECHLCGEFQ